MLSDWRIATVLRGRHRNHLSLHDLIQFPPPSGPLINFCAAANPSSSHHFPFHSYQHVLANGRLVLPPASRPARRRPLLGLPLPRPHLPSHSLPGAPTLGPDPGSHRQGGCFGAGGAVHEGNTRDAPVRLLPRRDPDPRPARRQSGKVCRLQRPRGSRASRGNQGVLGLAHDSSALRREGFCGRLRYSCFHAPERRPGQAL